MSVKKEFNFVLPRGFEDESGLVHRDGRMRLATALDEIESFHDPRVQVKEAYLPVVLLGRVITHLGTLPAITTQVMEGLFASDMAFLEDFYMRLNSPELILVSGICPNCNHSFQLQVAPLKGNW